MNKKFESIKSRILRSPVAIKIINNSSWLVLEKIINMLIGLFVIAIVARYFGPESFGEFNYALAFITLFTALSTLGMETLIVKSIIQKDKDEGTIIFTGFILRILSAIMVITISVITINYIEAENSTIRIIVLILSFSTFFKAFEVIEYWIQAHHKAKVSSLIRIIVYCFTSLLKVLVVTFNGDIIHFSVVYVLDVLIIGVALFFTFNKIRINKTPLKFEFIYARQILSQSWYLMISGLMITLYMRMDQVMLGKIMDNKAEVGVYSAAVKIAEMWYFLPLAIITSFKPIIIKNRKNNIDKYNSSLLFLYRIIGMLGIGFGIFIFIFSDYIINILYGSQYLQASQILIISIWAGTFAILGSARSVWLVCEGLQKYTVIFMGVGCIVNFLLNLYLIPDYGGKGAAISTLISQFVVLIVIPLLIKETRSSTKMILMAFLPKRGR